MDFQEQMEFEAQMDFEVQISAFGELTETISEYKWTLRNFSYLNEPKYKSKTFLINGIKWYITLYVNGIDNGEDHFSVSLHSNVNTTVACTITASNSSTVYKAYNFKHNRIITVIDKFIQRDVVLADLKKENCNLIIHLKFVFSNETQEAYSYFNLLNDIAVLFETRENADLTLVSNDENEHKVHKAILACRSKVFSAMFQHNMKECKDNILKIEDVDNETLKAMLRFIYTGELTIFTTIRLDLLKKLLIVADKYELNDLRRTCINNLLLAKLNFYNILDIIIMADAYNIDELKVKAKEYFLHNRKEILSTEKRENLKDLPRNIMEDLFWDLAFI